MNVFLKRLFLSLILFSLITSFASDMLPQTPPKDWTLMIFVSSPEINKNKVRLLPSNVLVLSILYGDTITVNSVSSYLTRKTLIRPGAGPFLKNFLADKIKSKEKALEIYNKVRSFVNNYSLHNNPDFKKNRKFIKSFIKIAVASDDQEILITYKFKNREKLPVALKVLYDTVIENNRMIQENKKLASKQNPPKEEEKKKNTFSLFGLHEIIITPVPKFSYTSAGSRTGEIYKIIGPYHFSIKKDKLFINNIDYGRINKGDRIEINEGTVYVSGEIRGEIKTGASDKKNKKK